MTTNQRLTVLAAAAGGGRDQMNRSHRVAGARRRRRPLAHLAVVLPLGAAALAGQAVATAPAAQAAATTTFSYTGSEQTYTIPPGTTAVTIAAVGAPGGSQSSGGGLGAVVTATVPVSALPAGTTTLYVEVGGSGQPISNCPTLAGQTFNGGGAAAGSCGGSGGGASDVRTTSIATVPDSQLTTANDSRLAVAGGGGGGGRGAGEFCAVGVVEPGGQAGDTTVSGPGNGGGDCAAGSNGGFGGTQAGLGGNTGQFPGSSGSLGQGGDTSYGGGGGGGYFGGGAGGGYVRTSGGGGAGSSFWVPAATGTSMSEDTTGTPMVQITPVITAPVVTGLSRSSGPLAGGTTVTVTGAGFTGATAVDFGSAAASSFTVNGDTSITATAPAAASVGTVDVTVTTPAGTSATSPADQYSYIYAFTGFAAPVANSPTVNLVHAGQAIPIQFQLGGNFGLGIVAAGYPTVQQVTCATGAPIDTGTETDTAGGSGLQYDATTGTYTYVWKTSKASKGTCQIFTLGLNDGTSHTALFDYLN